jgi:hypothetical protein
VTNKALQTAVCQCLWQLERSSTAREYSNFQNVGKIVCRETAIMSENKQMSVDQDDVLCYFIRVNFNLYKSCCSLLLV